MNRAQRVVPYIAMPLVLALIVGLGLVTGANEITVGFLLLTAILGLATWGGWAVGAMASLAATLCLNYFFLPPTGTLTIQEPSNWVALVCFLAASTLVSRLVTQARTEAGEAQGRQRELEILYDLSFGLFATGQRPGALDEAASRTLAAIGSDAGRVVLFAPGADETISSIGPEIEVDSELLDTVRKGSGVFEVDDVSYVPLKLGGAVIGALLAQAPSSSRAVVESAARLLALAIERERLLREAAHLEAVRESEALKTGLLQAVSHDLRTPLTSMRLGIDTLKRYLTGQPEALAIQRSLSVEQERLSRRIGNLLSLARLETGVAQPHPEPTPASSLIRAARESLALALADRTVEVLFEPDCPDVWTDPSLTLEILVNLLENAARVAEGTLTISAGTAPDAPDRVRIEIMDRGPGLSPALRSLLGGPGVLAHRKAAAGDSTSGGLGLRIAVSLAEANGGSLALLDRPGGGTVARLELPAAHYEEEQES
jgi:two-component system, OmpR family, sensor histidine kinase KdpD